MPSSTFKCNPESYYHITNRCINKDWFAMAMEDVWSIVQNELYFMKHAFEIKIYAFVLMSNHYHLLAQAPQANLSDAIGFFQAQTARLIVKKQDRINHLWGHKFKRCEIQSLHYFQNTYKYIYQNPLRAGVAERVEEYKYSSLYGLLGRTQIIIPLEEDLIFFEDSPNDYFQWMNQKPCEKSYDSMRLALRRKQFKLPKINKVQNALEQELF